ncbi:MAG: 16S rRNA (guanine(966)-N(2))-methyltransferase RsmD [Jhaorihella sp.]
MRIIAGRFRGRRLASVGKGDAGAHLRPTADRVRESLFNVLAGYGACEGARVLDLFAGTGALGLEALSRGAAHVTFVESGRVAQGLIGRNVDLTGSAAQTVLLRCDATRPGHNPGEPFDLVFLDPPYGKGLGERALSAAKEGGWLAPGALAVCEENAAMPPPPGCTLLDQRRYGDTWVTIMAYP